MAEGQEAAYRRVADELRSQIERGDLAEGTQLPTLSQIARVYEVPRSTAGRALDALRAAGLVVTRQGAGTYVRQFGRISRVSPARLATARWGAGLMIQDHDTGARPRVVDVVVGDVPAPGFAAVALGVDPGTAVLRRSRRFLVDDRPVQLAISYLPTELTRGTQIEHTDTGPGGTYARLAEAGHAPTEFTERVIMRGPTPDEAADLSLAIRESRVYEITRYAYAGNRCVEVNRMVLDAGAYELIYSFPA
jgi:GntR family transcriptional regulator